MLRVLMASQPVRAGWVASTAFSTVTHGALIAIAVATTHAISTVRETRAAENFERITYIEPARLAEALRMAREAREAKIAAAARARVAAEERRRDEAIKETHRKLADLKINIPDIDVAPEIADVADAWLSEPGDFAAPTMSFNDMLGKQAGVRAPVDGVYTEDMVERSVQPRRGNPKPRYPGILADMGVEGAFVVRFVVDSTGGVAADKIEFPSSMHRMFANAVRAALLKSHYDPAMIAGHFVAQQVVQEFRFEMGRSR
jgi:TonB family protein